MVDAPSAPGMAIDIRPSTLDAAKHLGPKLASILTGELARLRADSAFAQRVGIATHASASQADSLRAQRVSVVGNIMLGLTTQTDMRAERSHSAAKNIKQAKQLAQGQERVHGLAEDQSECDSTDEEDEEETIAERENTALARALQQGLIQFQSAALEAGFTGTPLAVLLPAKNWVLEHAPADICKTCKISGDEVKDLLVLCLAFDGSLGKLGIVMGLVFRGDRWIGSVRADWLQGNNVQHEDYYSLQVTQPGDVISPVIANDTIGSVQGLRVKIEDSAEELDCWAWRVDHWSWH